jgi:hypothetical protein
LLTTKITKHTKVIRRARRAVPLHFVSSFENLAGIKRCDSQERHPRMFQSGVQSGFRLDSR